MNFLNQIKARLVALFRKRDLDADMDDEMRLHIEFRTQANIAAGMNPEEARFAALRQFGWKESIKEDCREQRGVRWLENLVRDIRYGARQLRKNPGFTAVAVLTLALGIGACTAIFTVVNSVLLRPLAYPESGRLIVVNETHLPQFPEFSVAPGNYFEWREQTTSFEQLAASRDETYNLTGAGEPVRLTAERITPNYLAALRTRPAFGREFTEDEAESKARVVLLSHGFWLRQFGGRPGIVNETIQLNGEKFTVVGVLPANFDRGGRAEIFTPAAYTEDNQNRGGHYLRVVGRLKPGITLEQARSELVLIADRLAKQYPDTNPGWSVKLTPLLESVVAGVRPVLYSLLGAVGFLLLIACANVANLLLARATARTKEMSVRSALGASRARIVRQLLCENVVLAMIGGTLGVLIARFGMGAILALAPAELPRLQEIALDGRALGFTCLIVLLTGIGFGLVPAFQASRVNPGETLKDGNRGNSEGGRSRRLRGGLVVGEMAIALVLLVGAGLLIRSFAGLLNVNPGFQPRDAFAVNLSLPDTKYATDEQQAAFAEQALARLASLPSVESVAAANLLPLLPDSLILAFNVAGRPTPPPGDGDLQTAVFYSVTPDYLKAMGIPLVRGRAFTSADNTTAPRVALINEWFAKTYFPGADAVGQHLNLASGTVVVVGVVADVKNDQLDTEVRAQTYVPFAQVPFGTMTLVVRTSDPISGLPAAINAAIHAVDNGQPITSIRPLGELLATSVARQRFVMSLFAVFSGVALLLSAIGIYGVMAYSVTQRTSEIGLRMALGAQRADVLRLVFAQGGRLVALGLVAGLAVAMLLTRLLASMLFGVSAYDPLTFSAIALLFTGVAAFACWLPARRAARLNPMVALRTE